MNAPPNHGSPLWHILVPMWLTFLWLRMYLHLVDPDADLFIAGYNVHHLFTGAMIEIPAAFVLAMGVRRRAVRWAAEIVLGVGSAMMLDEVVYLIATDGSNASYLLPVSLWGAVVLMVLVSGLMLAFFGFSCRCVVTRED